MRSKPCLRALGPLVACTASALPLAAQGTLQAHPIECVKSLRDTSAPGCVQAASEPTLGRLYPLGFDFNIDPAGRVAMGSLDPSANLTITGTCLDPIPGTVSVASGSTLVTGTGTIFTISFALAKAICIEGHVFTIVDVADDLTLTIDSPHPTGATDVTAYRDGDLFEVENADKKKLISVQPSGKVFFKPTEPTAIRAEFHHTEPFGAPSVRGNIRLYNREAVNDAFSGISFHGPGFQLAGGVVCVREGGGGGATSQHGLAFWTTTSGDSGAGERVRIARNGNVGIGVTDPSNVLTVVQGSATDPIADAWTTYSSKRWKENVRTFDDAVEAVKRLRGVRFEWKESGRPDVGFIAEEVGEVLPEIVQYEDDGETARSLDYSRLTALLVEVAKEQQAELEELRTEKERRESRGRLLEQRLERLEARLASLED